jgi:hypothetical protein
LGFDHFWRRSDFRNEVECVAIEAEKHSELSLADARCIREHGVERGLEASWRTADDAEDFGGRLLPLQRFAQLAGGHRLPLRSRLLLRHRFVELAGEQCDLLFVAGFRGSCVTARPVCFAPIRFLPAGSDSCHPIPLNGLGAGEMLA